MKTQSRHSVILMMGFLVALSSGVGAQEPAAAPEPAPTATSETAPAAGNTATAAELIADAQRAVGQVVKAARYETTIPPDAHDAKPFWNAMKQLNEALDKADTGLTLKDETFFSNLALAVAAVQQAEIALEMNDVTTPAVRQPLTTLSGIVTALDQGDFAIDDAGMVELTDGLPMGWDEVESDIGDQMMQDFQSDFDHMPFEPGFEMNTFDDFGSMNGFGGGFDDFGGGWDF